MKIDLLKPIADSTSKLSKLITCENVDFDIPDKVITGFENPKSAEEYKLKVALEEKLFTFNKSIS